MKAILVSLAALLLAACLAPTCAAADPVTGYMINNKGRKIVVAEFMNLIPAYPCVYKESEMSIPLGDIKSITRLDDGFIMLENRKGRRFKVTGDMNISYDDMLFFKTANPITGEKTREDIDPLLVNKIVFD